MTIRHEADGPVAARTDSIAAVEATHCDLSAIPADRRDAHQVLARELLFGAEGRRHELPDGWQFELPVARIADVAAFVGAERRCCPHLAFSLTVAPRAATLSLRVTGPMAREELAALAERAGATSEVAR